MEQFGDMMPIHNNSTCSAARTMAQRRGINRQRECTIWGTGDSTGAGGNRCHFPLFPLFPHPGFVLFRRPARRLGMVG